MLSLAFVLSVALCVQATWTAVFAQAPPISSRDRDALEVAATNCLPPVADSHGYVANGMLHEPNGISDATANGHVGNDVYPEMNGPYITSNGQHSVMDHPQDASIDPIGDNEQVRDTLIRV